MGLKLISFPSLPHIFRHQSAINIDIESSSHIHETSNTETVSIIFGNISAYILIFVPKTRNETILLVDGVVTIKDQLKDYQFRGELMEDMNFLAFMLQTYEGKLNESEVDDEIVPTFTAGRPHNLRVPYKDGASKPSRCRIFRSTGHETLPRFVGKWFERSDDPSIIELYCAQMLLILKPWTNLNDLKSPTSTFEASWNQYTTCLEQAETTFIANAQYYHECQDSAKARRDAPYPTVGSSIEFDDEPDATVTQMIEDIMDEHMTVTLTENDLIYARSHRHDDREQLHAKIAMDIAHDIGIFTRPTYAMPLQPIALKATLDLIDTINAWDIQLKSVRRSSGPSNAIDANISDDVVMEPVVTNFTQQILPNVSPQLHEETTVPSNSNSSNIDNRPLYAKLNQEQKMAHDIVYQILIRHLSGKVHLHKKKKLLNNNACR